MARIVRYPEAVIVEMHDRPCFSTEDCDKVKQVLIQAGRENVRLVIDCAAVGSVPGAFLSVLLVAMKQVGARIGDIVLCKLQPIPLEVFQITRLDRVFPIYPTREEAILAAWPLPEARVVATDPDPDSPAQP